MVGFGLSCGATTFSILDLIVSLSIMTLGVSIECHYAE